ncbi:MAG: metallophosphoesterase family protein [Gammaproteobacteria bacterium]|nr:metallophosphoesterase family protein [Gammaproteobacteria bacterium]
MTLIGLISDVHATPEPVAEALRIFEKVGVKQVLCAGDIAGYMDQLDETITLLEESHCQTVTGNHDLLYIDHHDTGDDETDPDNKSDIHTLSFLKRLPVSYQALIEGKHLYMVHAQPPDGCHGGIKLLDKNGLIIPERVTQWSETLQSFDYDVLVIGHTHQVFAEILGNTLVINPGSSVFNNSCAILRLPEMTVEMIPLSGKKIEPTWNWGEHVIYGN